MEANTKRESAFPLVTNDGSGLLNTGMALRDYFAAAVLPNYSLETTAENAARISYEYADAMLKEREKC